MATSTIAEAMELVKIYRKQNIPSCMLGPPGIGKTLGVEQITIEEKTCLKYLELSTLESIDLRGLPSIDQEREIVKWIPPEMLPSEDRDGKKGILFLDEMNVGHPSVQAACMPLVQFGRIGSYRLPKGWYIVAAGNRQSDRASAQKIPTALADRFGFIFVEPDKDAWVEWANKNGVNPMIVAFIRWRPELLHKMDEADQIVFPTPRSWMKASLVCDIERTDLRFRAVAGVVGDGAASEYEGFYRTVKSLPEMDDIIKNPSTAMIPDEPSALYAVSTGLARMANKTNFKNVMTYAQRLDVEFEIITAIDATKQDPDLCDHKAYIQFAKRNKEIQI